MSIAALYISYRDKKDLIVQIGRKEVHKMRQATGNGFRADFLLQEGLRVQWQNRYRCFVQPILQEVQLIHEQLVTGRLRPEAIHQEYERVAFDITTHGHSAVEISAPVPRQ